MALIANFIAEAVEELLTGNGYVIIPEAIAPEQAAAARGIILQQAAAQRTAGTLFVHERRERLYGLLGLDELFRQLVQHPIVIAIIEAILGEDMTLGGFSAHILQPQATRMGAHVDYPYFTLQPPHPATPVLEIQAIWMLEEFTAMNGAPEFAAGTQRLCRFPHPEEFSQCAQPIVGQAGTVVLSHGLCWHNTSPNLSDRPRVAVLGNYNPKFVRPLEDPAQQVSPEILQQATPKLQQLLGRSFQTALRQDVMRLYAQYRPE